MFLLFFKTVLNIALLLQIVVLECSATLRATLPTIPTSEYAPQPLAFVNSKHVYEMYSRNDVEKRMMSLQLLTGHTNTHALPAPGVETLVYYEVVLFYTDWCFSCHHLAPVYAGVSNLFSCESAVRFSAFECSTRVNDEMGSVTASAFCLSLGIDTYPTVVLVSRKGQANFSYTRVPTAVKYNQNQLSTFLAEQIGIRNRCGPVVQPGNLTPTINSALAAFDVRGPSQRWPILNQTTFDVRLYDALSALVYMLGNWISLFPHGLTADKATHLCSFLKVAGTTLPGTNVRAIILELHDAIQNHFHEDLLGNTPRLMSPSKFSSKLMKHATDFTGLPALRQGISPKFLALPGITSAVWELFHIMGENSIIHGAVDGSTSPKTVAKSFRNFIASFFFCELCRSRFLNDFDGCKFGSCDWVEDSRYGIALWLHRLHNSVVVETAIEISANAVTTALERQFPALNTLGKDLSHMDTDSIPYFVGADVRFPHKEMCPKCRKVSAQPSVIKSDDVNKALALTLRNRGLSHETNPVVIDEKTFDHFEDFNLQEVASFLRSYYSDESLWDAELKWDATTLKFRHTQVSQPQQANEIQALASMASIRPVDLLFAMGG